jgi:uncharacterized iron-regulated membrane protein
MGIVVSLFVIFLVITGWALNHTATLGLARLSTHAPWIIAWYGLRGTVPATGYNAGSHWLIANENGALLDGKPTAFAVADVVGLAVTAEFIAIATTKTLFLLDRSGRLVDEIGAAQLPSAPLQQIAALDDNIVLRGESAHSSADGVAWQPFSGAAPWSAAQALPPDQQIFAKQLLPSLPLERLMQDIHSGRILGRYGPYLMDGIGLLFLLLAASGVWMFFRHRRR